MHRHGAIDIYDFHALETIQSFVERRKGGRNRIVAIQALQGDAVWKPWKPGIGEPADGIRNCLKPASPFAYPGTTRDVQPSLPDRTTDARVVKAPIAYRLEYADGLKGPCS